LKTDLPHLALRSAGEERREGIERSLSSMKNKIITRRDFLRVTAGAAMAATVESGILGEVWAEPTAKVSSSVMLRY